MTSQSLAIIRQYLQDANLYKMTYFIDVSRKKILIELEAHSINKPFSNRCCTPSRIYHYGTLAQ